ncbi:MAG: hypothetical protein ABGX84_07820 [Alcanivorax sp.]
MTLKTVNFDAQYDLERADAATYLDSAGEAQTAAANTPRYQWKDGEFVGLLLDGSISESAPMLTVPNFSATAGAFVIECDLFESKPFTGSGFDQVLTGSGTLVLAYANGVGKVFTGDGLLYEISDMTPAVPAKLLGGGAGKVRFASYRPGIMSDAKALETAKGSFEAVNVPSLRLNFAAGEYWAQNADGDLEAVAFDDVVTLSRPAPKTYWNRHASLATVPNDKEVWTHDPASLDASEDAITLDGMVHGDSLTVALTGTTEYPVGETVVVSDAADIDRYIAGEVTSSEAGSVTFTVRDKAGTGIGSDWVLIRSLGFDIEPEATTSISSSENFTGSPWVSFECSVTPNAAVGPDGAVSMTKLVPTTADTVHRIRVSSSGTSVKTVTCLARAAGYRYLTFRRSGGTYNALFDLQEGVVVEAPTNPLGDAILSDLAATIEHVGNNIYRCSYTQGQASILDFNISETLQGASGNGQSFAGDGVSGIEIFGVNETDGTEISSYIKANGSATIRSADVPVIENVDTAEWFGKDEGWLVLRVTPYQNETQDGYLYAATNQRLLYNSSGTLRMWDGENITGTGALVEPGKEYVICGTWSSSQSRMKLAFGETSAVLEADYNGAFSGITALPIMRNNPLRTTSSSVSALNFGKGFLTNEEMDDKIQELTQ